MPTRDIALRVLMVLACLTLVLLALPRGGKSGYDAPVDHPWHGRELVAPFEFPLLKCDEQMMAEQDSMRRRFAPYFRFDENVKVAKLTEWRRSAAAQRADGNMPSYLQNYVEGKLQYIYDRGVVAAGDLDSYVVKAGTMNISLVRGNEYSVVGAYDVFTPKSAYQYLLTSDDSVRFSRPVLQRLNLSAYLQSNLTYDSKKSDAALQEALAEVLPTSGRVLKGTRIVDRGEIVTQDIALKIRSLNAELQRRNSGMGENYTTLLGQFLFSALLLVCFVLYLILFRNDYIGDMRHVSLLAVLTVTMPIVSALLVRYNLLSVYVLPYAIVPIMARIFTDSRTAGMALAISVLLSAVALSQPFEFVVVELVAGFVAVYSLRELAERGQLIRCAIYVTIAALAMRLSVDLIRENSIDGIGWMWYIHLLIGGVLMLFAYPLLSMMERLFGFTSDVTLVELSNVNKPLLRRLSEEAPGTFQHCLQVANLAADVANSIGGKSQLVRTGALYHDIGKLSHPVFFTENQRGINPHDRLTPVQSARVIIGHVSTGLELAAKHDLPKVICDFIASHHGAGRVMYFYAKECEAHPDQEVDAASFTYPGPNPTTIEQAILMMADAVEAASRSLREYTDESITALVDKIVDGQMQSGAFRECPITFRDIANAKRVLADKLRTIYHTRISYPDLK